MAKLSEAVINAQELQFAISDLEQDFKEQAPFWVYVWYRILNEPDQILLVAYDTPEALKKGEMFR